MRGKSRSRAPPLDVCDLDGWAVLLCEGYPEPT